MLAALWNAYRAGWRPFVGYSCGLILLVNGAILPMMKPFGFDVAPLDWKALTFLVSTILGLGVMRTIEKNKGTDK